MEWRRVGYDTVPVYTEVELKSLYIAEGRSFEDAASLAKTLFAEISNWNRKEKRFWKKVHKFEIQDTVEAR